MLLLLTILSTALRFYGYAIIAYILLSWFPGARESQFGHFLGTICEPFLEPFRRIIPSVAMIDFSPIVAILVLNFAGDGLHALFSMLHLI